MHGGATASGSVSGSVVGLAASGSAAGVSTTQGGEMVVSGAAQQLAASGSVMEFKLQCAVLLNILFQIQGALIPI